MSTNSTAQIHVPFGDKTLVMTEREAQVLIRVIQGELRLAEYQRTEGARSEIRARTTPYEQWENPRFSEDKDL